MGRSGWVRAGWALTLGVGVAGCQEPAAPETPGLVPAPSGLADLADALRADGASVEVTGEAVPTLFGVPGRVLVVEGDQVQVMVFPDEATAASRVHLLGDALILWVAPARLFRSGAVMALHVGGAGRAVAVLERVMGPPVARVGGG